MARFLVIVTLKGRIRKNSEKEQYRLETVRTQKVFKLFFLSFI